MKSLRFLIVFPCLTYLLSPNTLQAQTELRHKVPTFSIEVPAGYERLTTNQLPETLYSFAEPLKGDKARLNFSLQDMGGIYGPARFKLEDIPVTHRVGETSVEDWTYAGLTLSTVVNQFKTGSHELISLTIQIPFKDRGLQINVTGPKNRESEARALLERLLRSLRGDLFDSKTQMSDEEIRRLMLIGIQKIAAIPAVLPGPPVRLYVARKGNDPCGWMRYEVSSEDENGRSTRLVAFEAILNNPSMPRLYARMIMRSTALFGLMNSDTKLIATSLEGNATSISELITVKGKSVTIQYSKGQENGEAKVELVSEHSRICCEPFIEALRMKQGEECVFVVFDLDTRTERLRFAKCIATADGNLRIEVSSLNELSERKLESTYFLDRQGIVKEVFSAKYGITSIRVTEREFEKLTRQFPK